jgi:mediator of RNA polymerase II transcription subunit 14
VQVINAHPNSLHCESVSLSRLIFSYGCVQKLTPNQTRTEFTRYQAIIDFSSKSSQLELQLEAGNPHIRILDHLTKILNSSLGLHGLATILSLTLPILRALDSAEDAWSDLATAGELQIFSRAADWYTVRYLLTPPNDIGGDTKAVTAPERIIFKIRLQRRGNAPWWCIRRDRKHNATTDPLDLALQKSVWTGGEKGSWMGMQCAAIAQVGGAEAMVSRVDAAMRDIATDANALASVGFGETSVGGLDGDDRKNSDDLGGQGIGQVQDQVVQAPIAPNKTQTNQMQRPQTKSPVLQKQMQKKNQSQSPAQQQRTQAALADAQHRAQYQAQQHAKQKEVQRQAQARQGQRPNSNQGNGNSGKQDAIVID